jgi:hypothetical protein
MKWRNYQCEQENGPLIAGLMFGVLAAMLSTILIIFNSVETKKYGPRRGSAFGDFKRK